MIQKSLLQKRVLQASINVYSIVCFLAFGALNRSNASTLISVSLPRPTPTPPSCIRTGCSGQLCVEAAAGQVISNCSYLPEYACYQLAPCERQATGECGFTQTLELKSCISSLTSSPSPAASPLTSPTPTASASPLIYVLPSRTPLATASASPSVSASPSATPVAKQIPGDINADSKVNLIDYAALLNDLFKSGSGLSSDLNNDQKVNILDYSILVELLDI